MTGTLKGPDGQPHLVRRDGSLVMEHDGRARPIRLDELAPASARIVRKLLQAQSPRAEGPEPSSD